MAGALGFFTVLLALSVDSLLAGIVAAPLLPLRRQRTLFAIACGLCDGVASYAGSSMGTFMVGGGIDLPGWLIYTAGVLLVLQGLRAGRAWLFGIPLLLGLDNLFAGTPAPEASVLALGSTLMAVAGLVLGSLGTRAVRRIAPRWSPA